MINKYSLKISLSIILAGIFIIIAFVGYNYQTLNSNAYVILYLLIAFIFLFGFAAGQSITMPLRKLLESADGFSKGDLKRRADFNSNDEVGQLTKVFNKIAEAFEKKNTESEDAKKSFDIKLRTRILILEEVVNALDKKVKNRTFEFQKAVEELEKIKEQLKLKDGEIMNLMSKMASKNKVKKTKEVTEKVIN